MTCGIYCIKNKANGKLYIGSSINIEQRFKQHQKELRHDHHKNDHLQKSINKYGLPNFEFTILETCLEDKLIENEDKWINQFNSMNSEFGYNKKSADRTIFTEETKQKHLAACNTPEFKQKSSDNSKTNIWGNEKVKEQLLKNQWVSMHTDEHRILKSNIRKHAWDTHPENKDTFSKQFKEKWNNEESPNRNKIFNKWRGSDEQKEVMSQKTQARWDDPIERQKMIDTRKLFGSTKEFKEKISNISTERWADPKFKKQMSKQRKNLWKTPEFKKKMQDSKKQNLIEPIKCKVCDNLFIRKIHNQTICSKECKYKDKNKKRHDKNLLIKK